MIRNITFIKSAVYFLIVYLSFLVISSIYSSQRLSLTESKLDKSDTFFDSRESLIANNENYRKGLEVNGEGNKEGALKLLTESKKGAVSAGQKATVDFTISTG